MHHALQISEVFREICAMLDRPSLPSVACTCRALHDPALDELWQDLYSIYPFHHLLTHATSGESEQCLAPQQWITLRKYSARTRSLYMCMIDDLSCFDRFPLLSSPPDYASFFPSLRTVSWYPNDHLAMLPFLRLLCGPALTSLSAEFATDPTSLAMLASLGALCPNITDISISTASTTLSEDLADSLSTSICFWNNLRHVSCDDLTVTAMEHLGQAKHLKCLTACASGRMSLSLSQPIYVQQLPFSRLEQLHLYTKILTTATSCLTGLRLALKVFRLDLFDAREVFSVPSSLHDLFKTLAEACSHTSLVRYYLSIIYPRFPSNWPDSAATIRSLRPLFNFAHLRVVSFEGLVTFSLSDNDIAELASAWPHLEELTLSTYVDHPNASLPTFQSLFRLVRACPNLCALALVIDTTNLVSVYVGDCDIRSEVLHGLCLGNSPISLPVCVAHVLHALYPALKQVDLSVWNKELLNRLPRREWYELCWGTVNIELQNLRGRK